MFSRHWNTIIKSVAIEIYRSVSEKPIAYIKRLESWGFFRFHWWKKLKHSVSWFPLQYADTFSYNRARKFFAEYLPRRIRLHCSFSPCLFFWPFHYLFKSVMSSFFVVLVPAIWSAFKSKSCFLSVYFTLLSRTKKVY